MAIFPILLEDFSEKDRLFNKKLSVFVFTFLALILGGLSSSNTAEDIWYQELTKSSLNPPGYVFGIVWPILYLLMGITFWRTYDVIKNLFFVQLFLNAIWSWLFFNFHLPVISLFDIWLLIFINIKIFFIILKIDKLAAFIHTPYILWLFFASYLNLFIVLNN